MALWWLLRAGVARVGLVGVPFPCGAGRTFGGFGAFEAWQTAALNAYKKPLLRPWGALEPLLWPCGGFCVRQWRVLGLLGYLFPAELAGLLEVLEGFGAFEAWQTAALNAYKKPLLRPWGALEPLLWPCGGFCVREWRVLGLLGYLFLAGYPFSLRSWPDFWRVWRVLERLRPGKRQP